MRARRRLPFLTAFLLLSFLPGLEAQVPTQVLVFPHLVAGGGWTAELRLIGLGRDRSVGLINIRGQNGLPLSLNINDNIAVSNLGYSIPPGESRTFVITSSQGTRTGWIEVLSDQFTLGNRGILDGVLTFRFQQNDQVVASLGVPPAPFHLASVIPFDNVRPNRTGLALVTRFNDTTITFDFFEETGVAAANAPPGTAGLIGSVDLDFKRDEQIARFMDVILPQTAGRRGFAVLRGTERFSVLVLNQDQDSLVLSTNAAAPSSFERDLVVGGSQTAGTSSQIIFRLRLQRFNAFFNGVADRITPSPLNELATSGQFFRARPGRQGVIRLTIDSLDDDVALSGVFLGRFDDNSFMDPIQGRFLAFDETGDVFQEEAATIQLPAP